jgi:hypothetical protein
MIEQKGIQTYLVFEDETCCIGSVLDGENLYDLIEWQDDSAGYLVMHSIPRIGDVIFINYFWFEVTGVRHNIYPGREEAFLGHTTSIRVKQIKLDDPRTNW